MTVSTDAVRTTEGWVPNPATERILSRTRHEEFLLGLDWEQEIARLGPLPEIPPYVRSSIHGIEGGYSNSIAAATWDPIVEQIFAEYIGDERSYRDLLPLLVDTTPARILDIACGTGESTLAWHRRFPDARITAIDVSPYMVVAANRKLAGAGAITVRCADAERLPFDDASFDVVTASLLFHELPEDAAASILSQMHRVCSPGGEVAVLEPYRVGGRTLSPIPFPEPYLKEFLRTDWDRAFRAAGFTEVDCRQMDEGWMRRAKRA
jgi:ubiquinone/menaquinone biosynthesis C-methylase UbiE